MSVQEFAKYVLDNIGRATLVNSFNIINKLDSEDGYPFPDFVDSVRKNLTIGGEKEMRIAIACSDALCHYSDSKYNKQMVIDNFIISVWEAVNGGNC